MRMGFVILRSYSEAGPVIYRGVAKPYRGPLYRAASWPLTTKIWYLFQLTPSCSYTGVDNPGRGRKGRSRLKKIPIELSQQPALYKGPLYSLPTPWYLPRSCHPILTDWTLPVCVCVCGCNETTESCFE